MALTAAQGAAELREQVVASMDYDQLRAAIERIVPLVEQKVDIGGVSFRWHKVADPDRLLSEAVQQHGMHAADIDPFWAVAWRAAQGLDRFLERVDLTGVRVLELGAGAGHAGIAAAVRGAEVTLSDAVELALLVARLNSWPMRSRVQTARLRWGDEQLAGGKFPVILGSDLVYDPSHFPQLERCARQHLAEGGRWLLSEPHRHTGDRFSKWILDAGWQCDVADIDMGDGRIPIRIFDCRLD